MSMEEDFTRHLNRLAEVTFRGTEFTAMTEVVRSLGEQAAAAARAEREGAREGTRWTDWRGNEYGIGDVIAYPQDQGSSSAYIVVARALDLWHERQGDGSSGWQWKRITEEKWAALSEKDRHPHQGCTRPRIKVEVLDREGHWPRKNPVTTLHKDTHVILLEHAP
jgi:hypothetical protein